MNKINQLHLCYHVVSRLRASDGAINKKKKQLKSIIIFIFIVVKVLLISSRMIDLLYYSVAVVSSVIACLLVRWIYSPYDYLKVKI